MYHTSYHALARSQHAVFQHFLSRILVCYQYSFFGWLSSLDAIAFLRLTRSPTVYFSSSARSTAICLSTIARLVPPIACLRSTLASKSNTA